MKLENQRLCVEISEMGAEITRIYDKKNDAELLWRCHSAVIHKEIPENLLTQAKNELALKEIYMQNRRFDEVKSGFPE